MSANEIWIQVTIPDDHEFIRFDPEKGEAVYKKKIQNFIIQRVDRGEEYYSVSVDGKVFANQDIRGFISSSNAATYNYDINKARCEQRAKRERARRKLEYIADRLNLLGSNTADELWCIYYGVHSKKFIVGVYLGSYEYVTPSEIYFHSYEAAETALVAMTDDELRSLSLHALP